MAKINDGGLAFPACNEASVNGTTGMSLRDWFAGQAAVSFVTIVTTTQTKAIEAAAEAAGFKGTFHEYIAFSAYSVADAMLAERAKGGA